MSDSKSILRFFKDPEKSKVQEQLAEYCFLRDFILCAAKHDRTALVARSDYDAFGFDLILGLKESAGLVQVQLKAFNGKTSTWDVRRSLLGNGGQVVIVRVQESNEAINTTYRMLDPNKRERVMNSDPKKPHTEKCKVSIGDTLDITKNLLRLFSA